MTPVATARATRGLERCGCGNKTLVFDDGTGLTIANNGSYWTEHPQDIQHAIEVHSAELRELQRDLVGTLIDAGALPTGDNNA